MTMDATGQSRCSSGAPLLVVGGGSPPATPSYSPSLPTTASTPSQAPPRPPPPPAGAQSAARAGKRCFDVAFLMAPDENLAKRQQLRLVAANALLKRASPPPHLHVQEEAPGRDTEPDGARARATAAAAAAAAVKAHAAGLFEPSGFFLPRSSYSHDDALLKTTTACDLPLLGGASRSSGRYDDVLDARTKSHPAKSLSDLHDSLQSSAMIRSAFTKVTASSGINTSAKFDAGALLGVPLPTSPSSSLSGGGLSPDHVAYQNSMSPPTCSDTTSPVPAHFLPSKQFPAVTMSLLSPQAAHAGSVPVAASKPNSLSSYPSTAFLLQQEQSAKHIKVANGLCGVPPAHASSNGAGGAAGNGVAFDSYLIKAQAPHLYDKELLFAGSGTANGPSGVPKTRPPSGMLYPHPDSMAAYSSLAAAAYPFTNFSPESLLSVTRAPPPAGLLAATNPAAAAAMVSASLLPPSFAALSLPAQNVCAKCNISFRMTSDLVYHMRSQHKTDSQQQGDPLRRRREQDKLKCAVCNESFRERHHLTRHMTAHQDKDGDADDQDDAAPADAAAAAARRRAAAAAAAAAAAGGGVMAGK